MDNYALFAVLLLALGLALLVAEVFIPSGGLILVVSLVVLAISAICAWYAWWNEQEVVWWWTYVVCTVLLIPSCVGGALYVFPRTEFGKNVLAVPPPLHEVTPYREEEERLNRLIHRTGTTLSRLNPGGLVLVDGERMHCESEGTLLESGTTVEVIGVKVNRLVVRPAVAIADASEVTAIDEAGDPDDSPLDFDVPQS